MIFGFAHLAVNVANLIEAEDIWRREGYTRTALHLDVPNHQSKQRFLTNYRTKHDLMLLAGSDLWPLELTHHGPTHSDNTQLTWAREVIKVTVPDPAPLYRFFTEGFGFRVAGDDLVLNSRLPAWSCRLRLIAGASSPVSLESAGPSCLAFYCNHIVEDVSRLVEMGATDNTINFDLTLGARAMTIAMLRAPGGPLLELINIRNKT